MVDLSLPQLTPVKIKSPHEAEMDEYTSFQELVRVGGKFYTMDGKSYCDTPLMSFVLDSLTAPGYRRIE